MTCGKQYCQIIAFRNKSFLEANRFCKIILPVPFVGIQYTLNINRITKMTYEFSKTNVSGTYVASTLGVLTTSQPRSGRKFN